MKEEQPPSVDPLTAQADRLERALAELEDRKRAAAEAAAKRAPDLERLAALQAKLEALPQSERREVLDAAGLTKVSAAPRPITPLKGGGFVGSPAPQKQVARWPLWLALPSVELWQAVLLSLGIEPDESLRDEGCGRAPDGSMSMSFHRLPREFFLRRQDCIRALSTQGPIHPQGHLYSGILNSPRCPVLVAEVAAFLQAVQYRIAAEMLPAPTMAKGPQIKRATLIERYERDWPEVERNLRDAAENGLSDAAKAPEHGMWFEDAALSWAAARGKYTPKGSPKAKAGPFDGL